jgi:hypothetical protein
MEGEMAAPHQLGEEEGEEGVVVTAQQLVTVEVMMMPRKMVTVAVINFCLSLNCPFYV